MPKVELREISPANLRTILELRVSETQRNFVASNAFSIAEAYFYPEAWFRAIYADDAPAGFVMLWDEHLRESPVQIGHYYLWRFMIDARFQGKGIGREAIRLLVNHVRTRPHAAHLLLSHSEGDGNPGPFYQRLGFVYTGKITDGELEMRLDLNNAAFDDQSPLQAE